MHARGALAELLLTFGAAYLIGEAVKLVWGLAPLAAIGSRFARRPVVHALRRGLSALSRVHDGACRSRCWSRCTRCCAYRGPGSIVRAALTHPATVETLGHNVPRVFTCVFAAGTALAALAGVIGAPLFVIEPSMAESIGPIVFVVVVIGGLGSLGGALAASLLDRLRADVRGRDIRVARRHRGDLRRGVASRLGRADASRRSRPCCRICCSSRCWRCGRADSSGERDDDA